MNFNTMFVVSMHVFLHLRTLYAWAFVVMSSVAHSALVAALFTKSDPPHCEAVSDSPIQTPPTIRYYMTMRAGEFEI